MLCLEGGLTDRQSPLIEGERLLILALLFIEFSQVIDDGGRFMVCNAEPSFA
jgi:hypothetical protein